MLSPVVERALLRHGGYRPRSGMEEGLAKDRVAAEEHQIGRSGVSRQNLESFEPKVVSIKRERRARAGPRQFPGSIHCAAQYG